MLVLMKRCYVSCVLHAINDHFQWCQLIFLPIFSVLPCQILGFDSCDVHTDFDQLLWSLGNLTLLEGPTNASVGNREYWEKCQKFFKRAKAFVGASRVYYSQCEKGTLWTPQQCSERGERMLR